MTFGYRQDAAPFSFEKKPTGGVASKADGDKQERAQAGFVVDICTEVEAVLRSRFDKSVDWKLINASNRFEMLKAEELDVLCGVSTVSLDRLQEFDSSLFVFLTGASFICTAHSGVTSLSQMVGKHVGVLKGTTTGALLDRLSREVDAGGRREFQDNQVDAYASYNEAFDLMRKNKLDCFFGDREILAAASKTEDWPKDAQPFVSQRYLSLEPYGLFVRRGNPELLGTINDVLVTIFRGKATVRSIAELFRKWFPAAAMSGHLKALYEIQQLPVGG